MMVWAIFAVLAVIIAFFVVYACIRHKLETEFEDIIPHCCDIVSDIEKRFCGQIIIRAQRRTIRAPYKNDYQRSVRLCYRAAVFSKKLIPARIQKFIDAYRNIRAIVAEHNERVEKDLLEENERFFDTCLKYPLSAQQRRCIIAEEENVLVVSSAGCGKTSSIIGKLKYLIERKGVSPDKILLISYTRKAASELTQRCGRKKGLKGYTFHKLALDIIGKLTGHKPSICEDPEPIIKKIYKELIKGDQFRLSVVKFLANYEQTGDTPAGELGEGREELALANKGTRLISALYPDMDGNPVEVRSHQENQICFLLTQLGVNFRYEEPYEFKVSDETHTQYRPDFSIYYVSGGKRHRLYLEHFAIDENHHVPAWFARDAGGDYALANRKYNDAIEWKVQTHQRYQTKLVYTTSADFNNGGVKEKLRSILESAGVPIHERMSEELYRMALPADGKKEKVFVQLIVEFIALMKSRCETGEDVVDAAKKNHDLRSVDAVENIFLPVLNDYELELKKRNLMDFTDAILQATELCRERNWPNYEYIIVDEFQDISIDRYKFLMALKRGANGARLFCVGDDWQSIFRFSGSDMALFRRFPDYFGDTEKRKIETTYRFGEPMINLSSAFIQRNPSQVKKTIRPRDVSVKTDLYFYAYNKDTYITAFRSIIQSIPPGKSILLLGRYTFDDYYLASVYAKTRKDNKILYNIEGRLAEFLTIHKAKGLEADYVILLRCNKDIYGFPSEISDDRILQYVLSEADNYPYGEERRLFYVAITRAREKMIVMVDRRSPSVFVEDFLGTNYFASNQSADQDNGAMPCPEERDAFMVNLYSHGYGIRYPDRQHPGAGIIEWR